MPSKIAESGTGQILSNYWLRGAIAAFWGGAVTSYFVHETLVTALGALQRGAVTNIWETISLVPAQGCGTMGCGHQHQPSFSLARYPNVSFDISAAMVTLLLSSSSLSRASLLASLMTFLHPPIASLVVYLQVRMPISVIRLEELSVMSSQTLKRN